MAFRKLTRLFFATDIHGSETCWRKFVNAGAFYDVDVLILGGDLVGRGLQLLRRTAGGKWKTHFLGQSFEIREGAPLEALERSIKGAGLYPVRVEPDEAERLAHNRGAYDALFRERALESLTRFLDFAAERLAGTGRRLVCIPGNDDPLFIDECLAASEAVTYAQGQAILLDDEHPLINEGRSVPAPWHGNRELEEDSLYRALEKQIEGVEDVYCAVFNIHAPPVDSGIDRAVLQSENGRAGWMGDRAASVGSRAVRKAIERYQPLLSLHGQVHEARGAVNIGRTLCLNPGSSSSKEILSGYLVQIEGSRIRAYQAVQG